MLLPWMTYSLLISQDVQPLCVLGLLWRLSATSCGMVLKYLDALWIWLKLLTLWGTAYSSESWSKLGCPWSLWGCCSSSTTCRQPIWGGIEKSPACSTLPMVCARVEWYLQFSIAFIWMTSSELTEKDLRCLVKKSYYGIFSYSDDHFLLVPSLPSLHEMMVICQE